MPRRIRRPSDKEHLFELLINSENAIFKTYKDLMMTAACLGYANRKRKYFEKSLEAIPWTVFLGDTDDAIIKAMAFAETKRLEILLDNEEAFNERFTIFEEYANAGLEILDRSVVELPGEYLDNMLDFMFEYENCNRDNYVENDIIGELKELVAQIKGKQS